MRDRICTNMDPLSNCSQSTATLIISVSQIDHYGIALTARAAETHTASPRVSRLLLLHDYLQRPCLYATNTYSVTVFHSYRRYFSVLIRTRHRLKLTLPSQESDVCSPLPTFHYGSKDQTTDQRLNSANVYI